MVRVAKKTLAISISLTLALIILGGIFLYIRIVQRTIPSSLSDLTWNNETQIVFVKNAIQDGKRGMLSLRVSDGLSAFFPGDWSVNFSPNFAFLFREQEIQFISKTAIERIQFNDPLAQIQAVTENPTGTRVAIVMQRDTISRICLSLLVDIKHLSCQTLDINKPLKVQWHPTQEDVLLVNTSDGLFYSYTVPTGKMNSLTTKKESEEYAFASALFQQPSTTFDVAPFFLGVLNTGTTTQSEFQQINLFTQHVAWFDDQQHILLKERNALKILEPASRRTATLLEQPWIDAASIVMRQKETTSTF